MAGAPTILAQAVPCLLNAFPGWKQPTHVRLRATIAGGAGAPTAVAAQTTPGLTISGGTSGVYKILFPNCRNIADVNVQIYSPTPETAAARYHAVVDADTAETNATTGELAFTTAPADDGVPEALPNSNIIEASFWLDLG